MGNNDFLETNQEDSLKEDRRWCVYMHTNKINNKVYVGITSGDPQNRWRNGNGYPEKQQPVFYRAIKKYGWDGFEHIIFIDGISKQEATKIEVTLIAFYKTNCNRYKNPSYGYNMTDGGEGSVGRPISDDAKRKMSEKLKGRFAGEKNPFYGKTHTDEVRKKISEKCRGREAPNKGLPMSDEQKAKISAALQGNVISEQTRQKLRNARLGVSRSDATKQKMSAARKGKYTGIDSPNIHPVYCVELHEIFWGALGAQYKYQISGNNICEVCKGKYKKKSAGKHPETGERLHWLYVEDAIREGYITQQDLDSYLQEIQNKGELIYED